MSPVNLNKLGILGGTFDPPHIGHLILAQSAFEQLGLDKLLFIPAAIQPLKVDRDISASQLRLRMIQLAIESDSRFAVSEIELNRPGISYTVDTLNELKEICEEAALFLIIGSDNVSDISSWKEPDIIFGLCSVVSALRPQAAPIGRYADKIKLIDMPLIDLSSTEIRSRVKQGKPIKYLVPAAVEQFIYQNRLYL